MNIHILDELCLVPGVIPVGFVVELRYAERNVIFVCEGWNLAATNQFFTRFCEKTGWELAQYPVTVTTYNEIMRSRRDLLTGDNRI